MKQLISLLALVLLSSCGTESTYSGHHCYFIFNTSYHPSSVLMGSVTGDNGFCLIYKGADKGQEKVFIEKPGEIDPNSPYIFTTDKEPKVSELIIGWDNGLLVGYSAIEGRILAFDRHCSRCEDKGNAHLKWYEDNGKLNTRMVQCPVCKTVYDLSIANNGLSLYPASYLETGFVTVLRVVN